MEPLDPKNLRMRLPWLLLILSANDGGREAARRRSRRSTVAVPAIIADVGDHTARRFLETATPVDI
jgi:hypothetical protein